MHYSPLPRRARRFLLWTARLALVAFVLQLSAVDHWRSDFAGVTGVEGSAAHVDHCHGGGDCSTGSAGSQALHAPAATLPQPSVLVIHLDSQPHHAPQAAFITPPSQPPQPI